MIRISLDHVVPLVCVLQLCTVDRIAAQGAADPTFGLYEPNPVHPYGRPHPDAPEELRQFAFMVGEFDCTDRLRQRDGTWNEFAAVWNAKYFLNGWGIQDQYWSPTFSTSNLRIYDPQISKWRVTYFRMPRYGSGEWQGAQEEGRLIMRQYRTGTAGEAIESRLTFYDITDDGFEWMAQSVVDGEASDPGWKSSCRRR